MVVVVVMTSCCYAKVTGSKQARINCAVRGWATDENIHHCNLSVIQHNAAGTENPSRS